MNNTKTVIEVDIKPLGSDYFPVKLNGVSKEIEYSDSIVGDKVVFFSAHTKNGYITDEPIRNLYFQEEVDDLKIVIFNRANERLTGNITLEYLFREEKEKIILPSDFIDISFDNNDVVEMGITVFNEEVRNSYSFNKISPVQVKYYRTEPDRKSADYLLNEYGIKELVEIKCCNLMTPKNTLPQDMEAMYTEWGYQYASFVASVSALYFEEIFGKGVKPRKDDFVVFMKRGIFMTITSVTPVYGGNDCIVGYRLALSHNPINGSVQGTESLEQFADTSEKFFRDLALKDGKDATNEEFNLPSYIHYDFNRKVVTTDVTIVEVEDKWNYYSPVKVERDVENPVVSYNHKVVTNKNFAVSLYYKTVETSTDDIIFKINDFIEFGIASSIPYVSYYGNNMVLHNVALDISEWHIFLLNFNLEEGKLDFIFNNLDTEKRTSKKHELPNVVFKETGDFDIYSHNSNVGRIRVWKNVLPIQFEDRILFSKVVEKPSSAYIIDDCNIILNSRTHARPDNMEMWKDFEKNRGKIN